MSLNKVQRIENNFRSDSFDDRVCDDLCANILQYLSLKDKLKLESVSKQFQRTILLSPICLDIQTFVSNKKSFADLEPLLKKLSNVRQIVCNKSLNNNKTYYSQKALLFHKAIELIIKYCNNLEKIQLNNNLFYSLNHFLQIKFINRFGAQLVVLDDQNGISIYSLLHHLNVKLEVETISVPSVKNADLNQWLEANLSKLKCLEIKYLDNEDLVRLEVIVECLNNKIKHLKLGYIRRIDDLMDFTQLINIICKLNNLVHLSLDEFECDLIDQTFNKHMKQMALKCPHLKSLAISYYNRSHQMSEKTLDEVLTPFKEFKLLTRLILDFSKNYYLNSNEEKGIKSFSVQLLKEFKCLTHLTLCFSEDFSSISETILTDIDLILPKLRSLEIIEPLIATGWTADVLSRLTHLENIELCFTDECVINYTQTILREKCRKIKNISIILFK